MILPANMEEKYNPKDWKPSGYQVLEDAIWSEEGSEIKVVSNSGTEQEAEKIRVIPGAFWSQSVFPAGDRVIALIRKQKKNDDDAKEVGMIVSQYFFRIFLAGGSINDAVSRMANIPSFPTDAQKIIVSVAESGLLVSEPNFAISDFLTEKNASPYFNTIKSYLLPEQRMGCERWLSSPARNKNWEKLRLFLQLSPTAPNRDRKLITYESILASFNESIIGYDDFKRSLATILSEKAQQKARGIVILLHGLPGTGKTEFATAIAKALQIAHLRLNLGNISSTISICGAESTYENSAASLIVQFFCSIKTSEAVVIGDEVDKLARAGSDRGKDGTVMETLLAMLDRKNPKLCDNFLEGVPIDCRNTVFILTANRIDNLPAELLNRCDIKHHMEPMDMDVLLRILNHHKKQIALENHLQKNWIDEKAIHVLTTYRSDFGARDVISFLKTLSDAARSRRDGMVPSESFVHEELSKIVDMNDPAVRFHRNEDKYPEYQKRTILDAFAHRASNGNLSSMEKRNIDLRLEYLTKILPDGPHHFNKEQFYEHVSKTVYGCKKQIDQIAGDCYAAELFHYKPEPRLFWGPSGVGKSAMLESITLATGRKAVQLQLNGVLDASYFRGTSPECMAADAGPLVIELAKAGTNAPLLYLDGIDHIGHDLAQALCDVLDGELYNAFLGTSINTSDMLIYASCNDLSAVDASLLSRFSVIEMPGYSALEKRAIAENFLLPEITERAPVTIKSDAFSRILSHYETDSGIRSMKQGIKEIVRQCLLKQRYLNEPVSVELEDVEKILGPKEYLYIADNEPGCVNGLVTYNGSCGMVMPIRVSLLKSGKRRVTGLPEDSIKDSIEIAETWLEVQYGYELKGGFHIQFNPPGVKKDGPSAGVAVAIALLSAVTGTVLESVAFTGGFDGRNILPVGGVPQKVQAAVSAGIETVFVPDSCRGDINSEFYAGIKIKYVKTMEEIVRDLMPQTIK